MKILFVFYNMGSGLSTHGGIALLSAIAKRLGHETKLLHFHESLWLDNPAAYIPFVKEYDPDIIAFTATDFEYDKVNNIAKNILKNWSEPHFPFMLLGGKSAVEIATKEDLGESPFDAFSIGDAEIPWENLLRYFHTYDPDEFYSLPGWWFNDGGIIKNPMGDSIKDLDRLPFPDWSIFDMETIVNEKGGWFNVQFSRGCMYNCSYCYVTADKKFQGERYMLRNNSVSYAIRYMEWLLQDYPFIRVFNLDDELPITIQYKDRGYDWWLDFCSQFRKLHEKYNVEFVANGRINHMTEEIIKAMVESGCRECRMGFESGSERIRKDILNKHISNQQMIDVYKLCDKHGLRTTSFTMIGIPTETKEDIFETFRLTALLKPDLIRLTFCYPFEGTKLYDYVKKNNLLKEDRLYQQSGYFEESVVKLPISDKELHAYRYLFPWHVNVLLLRYYPEEQDRYARAIKLFENVNFWTAEDKEKMLGLDRLLSEDCPVTHYAYHPNGYFICKNKVRT